MTATLVAVYAVFAAVLAWIVIGARGDWRLKAGLIVAAPVVAFLLWQGHVAPAGWPTASAPPAGARFVSGLPVEPDPSQGDRGAIFLWLIPADADRPRAYVLPYSRQLHKQVLEAMAAQKRGLKVDVKRAGARAHGNGGGSHGGRFRLYPHPAAVSLPPK